MEENNIEIYFKDLSPEKQTEIIGQLGENRNYDVIPVAVIPICVDEPKSHPEGNCPGESQHQKYDASITISRKDADYYNELLGMDGMAIYARYGLKRDECPCKLTACFSNGYQMDIDLIICEEDSPYLNVVLFDDKGNEVNCETEEAPINDEYYLSDGTVDYFVKIEVSPLNLGGEGDA